MVQTMPLMASLPTLVAFGGTTSGKNEVSSRMKQLLHVVVDESLLTMYESFLFVVCCWKHCELNELEIKEKGERRKERKSEKKVQQTFQSHQLESERQKKKLE